MLAGFAGLRELTVHLTSPDLLPVARYFEETFEPLKRIRALNRFDVFLPWTEQDCAEVATGSEYPFTLLPYAAEPELVHPHGKKT